VDLTPKDAPLAQKFAILIIWELLKRYRLPILGLSFALPA
jgi:hypothetical protein